MILTEQEAKTKWCPLARMSSISGHGDNRYDDGTGRGKCLASGCMAWRWGDRKSPEQIKEWDPCKTGPLGYCGA